MSTLNTRPIEVLGGMQWIKIASVESFSSITYDYDRHVTAVAFNSGYSWKDVYNTLETINFSEESISGPLGDSWHSEVTGFIPGKLDGIDSVFEVMSKQRWIVAVNDWDERVTIVGNIENGCRFKFKFDSKSKVSNLKGVSVSFFRDDIFHTRAITKSVLF
jgi:hypothetical protein